VFSDEQYISMPSAVRVYRHRKLKKRQKWENQCPKIDEMDPNREKSTENSKITPAKQAKTQSRALLRSPTKSALEHAQPTWDTDPTAVPGVS
jgi:hypothetical protein